MKINGRESNKQYANLEQLLLEEKYDTKYVAVECNGAIIPKAEYQNYVPAKEDEIEVVSFVGGG